MVFFANLLIWVWLAKRLIALGVAIDSS